MAGFEGGGYVAPSGTGYMAYVPGQEPQYYSSQADAEQAYNRMAGVGAGAGAGGYGSAFNQTSDYYNPGAAQLALSLAAQSASAAYQAAMLDLQRHQFDNLSAYQKEQLALQRAQDAWTRAYQQATLTGYVTLGESAVGSGEEAQYETVHGARTVAQMRQELRSANYPDWQNADGATIAQVYASTTGHPVSPMMAGGTQTPTMARQQMEAELTGTYQGQPTLAAKQWEQQFGLNQGELTGYYDGRNTLARDALTQETAQNYLNLLASLRGPADYFQYLKVLNGTPQGMRDLVNAAAGQYTLPGYGGAAPGATPRAADLGTLMGDVAGKGQSGGNWASGAMGQAQPVTQTAYQTMAVPQTTQPALPRPSQWNARNYSQMTPTQRDLLYGYYESQGWRPEDAEALFRKSLPRYSGPMSGAVAL